MSINFMQISFYELYYDVRLCFRPNNIIPWFNEGIVVCTPRCTEPIQNNRLLRISTFDGSLERPESLQMNGNRFVIMQILHMTPLMIGGFDEAEYVVHELLVVSWASEEQCVSVDSLNKRFVGRRRGEEVIRIVLDDWVSYANINVCSKGHVALVFDELMYQRILRNSDELRSKVRDQVDFGKTVTLGRSVVEISRNLDNFHNARALLRRVFELSDIAVIGVESATNAQVLQGLNLIVTDNLDGLTPPPPPSEYDE